MKPSASGRILMWHGGSLWIGLAGEPARLHAHHAVQIALPFSPGKVRFRIPSGNWKSYAAAIVAAQQPHEFEARGQMMAQVFVEPESRDGRALQLRYRDEGIAALPVGVLKNQIAALATAFEKRADDAKLIALALSSVATLVVPTSDSNRPLDARIARAVELIQARLDETISLKSIATEVHLSPDRFRHLFIEQTGVAFRPYVLWLRLECALRAFVSGKTLTEAAYAGGFSDSAHFSRTFKKMFGIVPASVRPE